MTWLRLGRMRVASAGAVRPGEGRRADGHARRAAACGSTQLDIPSDLGIFRALLRCNMSSGNPVPTKPFKKLLVANRSEIAIRIFRAANELGIRTVAIYAQEDRLSIHRSKADEAYQLNADKGPVGAYLDIQGIIDIALDKGVDAIHPGYGFLSENPELARACADNGIAFIGPRAELLAQMGDKTAARELAQRAKVPTLPGTEEAIEDRDAAMEVAGRIGFPLIIKAAHGGGGRGMRVVRAPEELDRLLDEARTEAQNAFGNGAVFLERFIQHAKHIEVQILADPHGNVVHLHERDCSVQRRHQKVIEIAPSVDLAGSVRHALCDAAVRLAREIGYENAGTVEFLVDAETGDVVLHRDEPAHPGGAHGHRGDHQRRSGALADPHRLRAPAARCGHRDPAPGRHPAQRLCAPVPHHHRGSGERLRAGHRAHPHLSFPGGLRHPPRRRHRHQRRGGHALLRLPAGQAHGALAGLGERAGAHAARPATNSASAA